MHSAFLAISSTDLFETKEDLLNSDERMGRRMNTAEMDRKKLLTSWDVASLLSIGERTVWKWAASDRMPKPVRLGGVTRWMASEIDQWLAEKAEER
jgi:predicted DNA-binding transcriptional regulator AlpA